MSADLEKENKEDFRDVPPSKSLSKQALEKFPIILKSAEIIICMLCIGLFYDAAVMVELGRKHTYRFGLIYSAFTTYMISTAIFLGHNLATKGSEKIPYKTSVLLSSLASAHFFVAGILLIVQRGKVFYDWIFAPHDYMKWYLVGDAIFAFVNVILFALDAVLTFLKKGNF